MHSSSSRPLGQFLLLSQRAFLSKQLERCETISQSPQLNVSLLQPIEYYIIYINTLHQIIYNIMYTCISTYYRVGLGIFFGFFFGYSWKMPPSHLWLRLKHCFRLGGIQHSIYLTFVFFFCLIFCLCIL